MTDKSIFVFVAIFATIGIGSWWIGKQQSTEIEAVESMSVTTVRRPGLEVVGESTVNLGKFNAGVPIGYHFELRNVLDRDVIILAANPSCGCMKIPDSIFARPIAPGAIVEVPVIMKTESRSGELSGIVRIVCGHKPATGTKITENSEVTVHLKCEIQNRIKITPDKIHFGNIVSGESAVIPFSVERTDGGSLSDVNISVAGAHFQLDGYEIVSENGRELGRGQIKPAAVVFSVNGHYGGTLELSCQDIGVKESIQVVDISGVSEPDLTTVPRNLVLFTKRNPTAELKLVGTAVDSIVEIIVSPELAGVTCEQDASTLRVTYDLEGGGPDNKSHISGEIVIVYQKVLPDSIVSERCTVRLVVIR
ncbi:MAG: DUF1573 domain-containing protein [Pirellulaceae bacterium]|nr:DUF1573 domain-containing protein [Pirellulaceae bacterium]